jgi:hypothetical protein
MTDKSLYERWDPETQRSTEVFTDSETGLPVFVTSQNTKPIIESAKQLASSFDPHVRREVTHVARIPLVIWHRLVRTGIAKDEAAMNKWLNSREGRLMRCDDGRRL